MILPFPKESPNASTGTTSRGAQGHPMPQVVVRLLLGHGNGTAWDAFFFFSKAQYGESNAEIVGERAHKR